MARPRKPLEAKRLHGRSPTKDAAGRPLPRPVVVPLPQRAEAPEPPESLGAVGRKHWARVWSQAWAWCREVDAGGIERYAQLFEWRDAMIAQIAEEGFTAAGSTGQARPHPLIAQVHAINSELRLLETQLGLNPSARALLGAEVRQTDGLDAMIARRRGSA